MAPIVRQGTAEKPSVRSSKVGGFRSVYSVNVNLGLAASPYRHHV